MQFKTYFLLFALFLLTTNFYSQVGIGTTNPSPKAMLEVSSQTNGSGPYRGFMPPRVLNIAARNGINPGVSDSGLMVYVLNNGAGASCLQLWDGYDWKDLNCFIINTPPVATDVLFSGAFRIGGMLTANFTYTDADGDLPGNHLYTWYLASDSSGSGSVIAQTGINNTFNLLNSYLGKHLAVEVTPVAISGVSPGLPVISAYRGPISNSPTWPAIQNFETAPPDFELPLISHSGGDFTAGNGTSPDAPLFASPVRGYGVSNTTGTMLLGPIDISSSVSGTFKIRLAGFSMNVTGNGMDATDTVIVSISTDSGANFSEEIIVKGGNNNSSNNKWDFDAQRVVTVTYDGNDNPTSFTSGGGNNSTNGGIAKLEITGIPNTETLVIRIDMKNTDRNELWVIDDAEIWGN